MSEDHRHPRSELPSRLLVLALVGLFVLGLLGFVAAVISSGGTASPEPSATDDRASGSMPAAPRLLLAVAEPAETPAFEGPSPGASTTAERVPLGSAGPSPQARRPQLVPVAVVNRYWSARSEISRKDAVAALREGESRGYKGVSVDDRVREPLAAALGITIAPSVEGGDAGAVADAVSRGALGFMAAPDVPPSVKALELNGKALFGNDRLRSVADWPLLVSLDLTPEEGWHPERTWVLVAGGDSFTDRGVYDQVVNKRRGVGFPFDGGTARVTGHGCCDPVFRDNVVPRYVLTGGKGAVRRILQDAELAIVNHEAPVTHDWGFHRSGLRFSGKPDLTRIFVRAGIDWVSLANNHIKDYGSKGIQDTRRILRRYGIRFGGAGKDLAQARRISYLEAAGTRLAIIPCVGVVRFAWAGPDESGGTPCLDRYLVPDIKKAARDADLVVVFPHWGVEYTRRPLPSMRKHAARWVKAGADLILGAHSHVAGAVEDIEGRPVLYSLGNLIFDQHWSTNTMEGVLVEATFHGPRLAQLRLHPYLIHAQSQPNLLDPARGEGRRLLREMRAASKAWLDW